MEYTKVTKFFHSTRNRLDSLSDIFFLLSVLLLLESPDKLFRTVEYPFNISVPFVFEFGRGHSLQNGTLDKNKRLQDRQIRFSSPPVKLFSKQPLSPP